MTTPKEISKETLDLLEPDWMKGKSDAGDPLVPVTPRRLSQGELDRLLTPKDLLDVPDPFAGTAKELIPLDLRGGEDDDDELQATAKTPDEKEPAKVSMSFGGCTLGEWLEKQAKDKTEKAEAEKLEQEIESHKVEDENREIKESFQRVAARMKGDALTDDLVPDNLK